MAILQQIKRKCETCKKEIELYSGFEHWCIVERARVLPLCEECSDKVRGFIEELKGR